MSESNNVKIMEKKVLLFFLCSFFPVVYKIVPPPLATASFSIPDLFIEDDKSSGDPWNKVSLNILSEKQSSVSELFIENIIAVIDANFTVAKKKASIFSGFRAQASPAKRG